LRDVVFKVVQGTIRILTSVPEYVLGQFSIEDNSHKVGSVLNRLEHKVPVHVSIGAAMFLNEE
jgi:hypothetical protein